MGTQWKTVYDQTSSSKICELLTINSLDGLKLEGTDEVDDGTCELDVIDDVVETELDDKDTACASGAANTWGRCCIEVGDEVGSTLDWEPDAGLFGPPASSPPKTPSLGTRFSRRLAARCLR